MSDLRSGFCPWESDPFDQAQKGAKYAEYSDPKCQHQYVMSHDIAPGVQMK